MLLSFSEAGGYDVLLELVLSLEVRAPPDSVERLIQGLTALCYVGTGVPRPSANSTSPYGERRKEGAPNEDRAGGGGGVIMLI